MLDFLAKRLAQVRQRKTVRLVQEQEGAERRDTIATAITHLKSLLADQRYGFYRDLLLETKRSLEVERETLLQTETDRDVRDYTVTLLTGRILQLEWIVHTPESFFELAEQLTVSHGKSSPIPEYSAARSPAREPVGSRERRV